jgi:hypothetical protein
MKLYRWAALAGMALLLSSAGAFVFGPSCGGVPAESTAMTHLRTINTAEVTYLSSENRYGTLEELVASGRLDSRFRTTVSDYDFAVTATDSDYKVTAEPNTPNFRSDYYSGPDGVIRYGRTAPTNLIGRPVS